jgi:Zn-finger nucleic acid-binding protein
MELSFNLGSLDNKRDNQNFSIPSGSTNVRILPPFGTNHNGALSHFYGVHWGFLNANAKMAPVSCSYSAEKYCPVCELVWSKEKELTAIVEQEKSGQAPVNADAKKVIKDFIQKFSADKGHYFNALLEDGRVVRLKAGHKLATKINEKLKEAVEKRSIDPVALDSGIWLTLTRTGEKLSTEYNADFKRSTVVVDGETYEKVDTTKIEARFPDIYAAIKRQLTEGGKGPLHDIHTLFDTMSSSDLRAILNGAPVPSRRRNDGGAVSMQTIDGPLQPRQEAPATVTAGVVQTAPTAPVTPPAPAAPTQSLDISKELERLKSLGAPKA